MRAREFLIEYQRDITAKKVGDKLLARNKAADMTKLNTAEEILSQLETGDPTKNKQYMVWIINRYIAGDFFLEDLEVVKQYLEKFIEAKNQRLLDIVDIGKYTLGTLKEKINGIYKSEQQQAGMIGALYPVIPGTKVLYNGSLGQFAIMSTLKGSMNHNRKVGNRAEWCTADSRAPSHYQSHAGRGPLYVYVDTKGDKYQLHFETNQFKDKNDNEIAFEKQKQIVSLPFVWKNIDWTRAIQVNSKKAFNLMPVEIKSTPEMQKAEYEYWYHKLHKNNFTNIENLPPHIKNNPKIKQEIYEYFLDKIQYINSSYLLKSMPEYAKTFDICHYALRSNPLIFKYMPEKIQEFYNTIMNSEIYKKILKKYTSKMTSYIKDSLNLNAALHKTFGEKYLDICKENIQIFYKGRSQVPISVDEVKKLQEWNFDEIDLDDAAYKILIKEYKWEIERQIDYIEEKGFYDDPDDDDPEEIRHIVEIRTAIKKYNDLIEYMLDESSDFIKELLTNNPDIFNLLVLYKLLDLNSDDVIPHKFETPELWAVNRVSWLENIPDEFITKEMAYHRVMSEYNKEWLEVVPEKYRTFELCLAAVKKDKDNLDDVPEEIRDEVARAAGL